MARYYYGFDRLVNEHHKYVMGPCLTEPVIFNALMAKVLSDFRCGRGIFPSDFVPPDKTPLELATTDIAYYKMRTMRCLQDSINPQEQSGTQPLEAALFAIILLVKLEVMNGTAKELELHLGALKRLVKMGCNVNHMSATAMSPTLFTINVGCAITRGVPPIIPPSCSDSTLWTMDEDHQSSTSQLCKGFEDPAVNSVLGPRLLCYLIWQKNFFIYKSLALARSIRVTTEDYGNAANMIHRADYHLLSLHYLHTLTPVQEVARLALLIADFAAISGLPPKTTLARSLAVQLKKALQLAFRSMSEIETFPLSRLLLWSCFMGAHVATGCKERPWFLMKLISLAQTLQLTNQEQLQEIVLSFLYSEQLFAEVGPAVWEEMQELADDLSDGKW